MSLLPSATYAGPGTAEALWAAAGAVGPGGGVTQLVAGTNVTLEPPTGLGVVTINASGGGGGSGVLSVTASGAGISATPTTGAVVVENTGVTSIVAGGGIGISGTTGAVTVTNTATAGGFGVTIVPTSSGTTTITTDAALVTLAFLTNQGSNSIYANRIWNNSWSADDVFIGSVTRPFNPAAGGALPMQFSECEYITGSNYVSLAITANSQVPVSTVGPPQMWLVRFRKTN